MVTNYLRWLQIIEDGYKLLEMVTNYLRWLQINDQYLNTNDGKT